MPVNPANERQIMKKTMIAVLLGVAVLGAQTQKVQARDCFNPLGAVIGGIVAGAVIADAFTPHTVYYAPQPVYCPPPAPVVYAPPCEQRVVYVQQPQPVYYAPRCEERVVYVQPRPVCYEPAVRVSFGFGAPFHHSPFGRHGW
jgi:hypothetical protein